MERRQRGKKTWREETRRGKQMERSKLGRKKVQKEK
jgi:hypothetical protein